MSEFIEFKDVKKIYKMGEVEIEALSGVNFSIKKGEFVVVAGASGAGKSTILNILGGMDTPTKNNKCYSNLCINSIYYFSIQKFFVHHSAQFILTSFAILHDHHFAIR